MTNRSGQGAVGGIVLLFFAAMLLLLVLIGLPFKLAMAIMGGFLVFVLALVNTDLALIVLIFAMLLSPEFVTGETGARAVKIRVDDIFIIIIFFGWLAKMAINKELGLLRTTRLNAPIMIYTVICLFATFLGVVANRTNPKSALFYVIKYIEYFMLFFMVSNNLKTVRQAKKFIFFLFLTCFITCIYAGAQISAGERVSAPFEMTPGGEPNTFAGYLILMMSLAAAFIIYPGSAKQRFLLIGLMCFAGVAFLMTLSRSGWISFFPAILTFVVLSKEARAPLIVLVLLAAFILPVVAPEKVQQRVAETFTPFREFNLMGRRLGLDESTTARIDSWGIGFRRWMQKPVFGYGIPAGAVIDNQYTRVLNETGAIGFAVFLWLLLTVLSVTWKTFVTMYDDRFARAVSLGLLAGYVGILLLSSSAAAFIIIRIMEPFWFLVAIVTTLPELEKDTEAGLSY